MPKGNDRPKWFYYLMETGSGDLMTFKLSAKSRRFGDASAKVRAGLRSTIVESCKKGDMCPSPRHPKLREFMGYQ